MEQKSRDQSLAVAKEFEDGLRKEAKAKGWTVTEKDGEMMVHLSKRNVAAEDERRRREKPLIVSLSKDQFFELFVYFMQLREPGVNTHCFSFRECKNIQDTFIETLKPFRGNYEAIPERVGVAAVYSVWSNILTLVSSWRRTPMLDENELEKLKAVIGRALRRSDRNARWSKRLMSIIGNVGEAVDRIPRWSRPREGVIETEIETPEVLIEALLKAQLFAYEQPRDAIRDLTANKLAAGYLFGFHDMCFQIFGLLDRNDPDKGVGLIKASYHSLFGEQPGVDLLKKSIQWQNDDDFQIGRRSGGEEYADFTYRGTPPLGLQRILTLKFDAAAVGRTLKARHPEVP